MFVFSYYPCLFVIFVLYLVWLSLSCTWTVASYEDFKGHLVVKYNVYKQCCKNFFDIMYVAIPHFQGLKRDGHPTQNTCS